MPLRAPQSCLCLAGKRKYPFQDTWAEPHTFWIPSSHPLTSLQWHPEMNPKASTTPHCLWCGQEGKLKEERWCDSGSPEGHSQAIHGGRKANDC